VVCRGKMTIQQSLPISILIVDDHAVLRFGLRALLESQQHLIVVGEASDRSSALALAISKQPDIILLDLDLGNDNGFDLLPSLLDLAPNTRVIVLTGMRDPAAHERVVLLGAMGVVLKETALELIIKAIDKVHAGEVWLDRTLIASILNTRNRANSSQEQNARDAKIAALTDREREVVGLIAQGLRNKAIAERLVISEATVRNHLTSIFSKLEVADRFELVVFAYQNNLAVPPQ
jgi:two-component system, NarL family, nitrate/nitrite response regulator NarL